MLWKKIVFAEILQIGLLNEMDGIRGGNLDRWTIVCLEKGEELKCEISFRNIRLKIYSWKERFLTGKLLLSPEVSGSIDFSPLVVSCQNTIEGKYNTQTTDGSTRGIGRSDR
jgi:hypothetical protein